MITWQPGISINSEGDLYLVQARPRSAVPDSVDVECEAGVEWDVVPGVLVLTAVLGLAWRPPLDWAATRPQLSCFPAGEPTRLEPVLRSRDGLDRTGASAGQESREDWGPLPWPAALSAWLSCFTDSHVGRYVCFTFTISNLCKLWKLETFL